MRNKLIVLSIVLINLILVVVGVITFIIPGQQYQDYKPTIADTRNLVYLIPTAGLTFNLNESKTDQYLNITKEGAVAKVGMYKYDSQAIETIFRGWLKYDQNDGSQLLLPPTDCKYVKISIDLSISERYTKLSDFDPNSKDQNNTVLQEFFCQSSLEPNLSNLY